MSLFSILDRSHTVAKPGFSRWMVPPAALCVHLCIGQAYAFSVFNLPMTKLIGITKSAPGDWKLPNSAGFSALPFSFSALSAAVFGRWVEENGPRRGMFVAALCWGGGFLVARARHLRSTISGSSISATACSAAADWDRLISPVSTLIKWFPDRPGMATGMAIMGFGGGAFIASPLSVWLMQHFSTPTHVGVAETLSCLGMIYFCFMLVGSAIVRVPAPGWQPAGYVAPAQPKKLITDQQRVCLSGAEDAAVLADLVGAVPERDGRYRCARPSIGDDPGDVPGRVRPVAAAGFVGLMSLFNMGGRFFWASIVGLHRPQDDLMIFFVLGTVLYALVPHAGDNRQRAHCSSSASCVIISMYGGGFATVPAYLKDMFGTRYVGAIHGMLLTAWSAAGIFGPVIVNYISAYESLTTYRRRIPIICRCTSWPRFW